MTTTAHGLSGLEATLALARLAVKRVLRGKTLWVALALGLLPCLVAFLRRNHGDLDDAWNDLLDLAVPLLAIVPPLLVSTSLSDEIDEKTASYLWSRALPRWTVVAGKLLGLAPIAAFAVALGVALSWILLGGDAVVPAAIFGRSLIAVVAGGLAASAVAAMFATLAPRFATPLAIGWLLLDTIIGALSVKIHVIAVTFGPRAIIAGEEVVSGVISLIVLTAVALAIAVRRIERIE